MGDRVKTLYGKGDRVRVRSITSEMPAVVVEDEDGRRGGLFGERVVKVAVHGGKVVRDIPRSQILGRLDDDDQTG